MLVVKHWTVRAADPADPTPGNLPLFIAKLRTDGGGEYTSREFTQYLRQKGIEAQVTAPYTPQSNGVSERANRTIMERVRSMISWARLPDSFWAEAVATATYVKNCTPIRGLEDLKRDFHTPFEGWFGRVPDLGHVRVWGCVAMVHVPAEKTRKLDGRSEKCIFVGYCLTKKQYKVYNPVTRRMFSTRDVVFREEEKWGKIGPLPTNTTGSIGGKGIWHDLFQLSYHLEPFILKRKDVPVEDGSMEDAAQLELPRLPSSDEEDSSDYSVLSQPEAEEPEELPPPKKPSTYGQIGRTEMPALRNMDSYHTPDLNQPRRTRSAQHSSAHGFFTQVIFEPKTYRQALDSEESAEWLRSMQRAINSINVSSLGAIVEIPEGRKAIESKWVYRVKTTPEGELDTKLKARLVALGNWQVYGDDYADTYASVARHETVNLVLTLIAEMDLEVECLDVCIAFLGSPLEDGYEVYLRIPDGVDFDFTKGELVLEKEKEVAERNRRSWAVLLKKSIYGLKQSPRQWYKTVTAYLSDLGFVATSFDSGLLYHRSVSSFMVIVLFVDDLLLASSSSKLLQDVKSHFCTRFKVTESGDLASYIELKIERQRSRRTVTISQRSYLESILERFGFEESRSVSTPQEKGFNLFPSASEDARRNQQRYHEAIGFLMYATTTTRPDLAYAVGVLARFSHHPAEGHWAGVKRVLRYLKGTLALVLTLGGDLTQLEGFAGSQFKSGVFVGYTDSDWGGDPATLKSTSGYAARLGTKGIVSWRSTRQPTCAQ